MDAGLNLRYHVGHVRYTSAFLHPLLIGGIGGGVVILTVLIVALIVVFRRRKQNANKATETKVDKELGLEHDTDRKMRLKDVSEIFPRNKPKEMVGLPFCPNQCSVFSPSPDPTVVSS